VGFGDTLSIISLVLSLVAITITAYLSVRQVTLMRHANELPAFVDLLQEYRSGNYYAHQYFILNDLQAFSPQKGYSGLPPRQRKHFLVMFDYMSSMACLVSFNIVSVNHVFAMYGYLFQDIWHQMRPFVEKERELTGREIGFMVEYLCRKLSDFSHTTAVGDLPILTHTIRTVPRRKPRVFGLAGNRAERKTGASLHDADVKQSRDARPPQSG
jgi:hypothetical protein